MKVLDIINEFMKKFDDSFEASIYSACSIKFKDDMAFEEFEKVFQIIKNNLGEPSYYSICEGYVWDRKDFYISFGTVSLYYKYQVPMLKVFEEIHKYDKLIDYKEYSQIIDIMYSCLKKYKTKNLKKAFYYDGGYLLTNFYFEDKLMFVEYKDNIVSVALPVPGKLPKDFYKKETTVESISKLEYALDLLLKDFNVHTTNNN